MTNKAFSAGISSAVGGTVALTQEQAHAKQVAAATNFLWHKLSDYVGQCNVPALAAVLVRESGDMQIYAQRGIRKADPAEVGVGSISADNHIQASDKFCLGSISKVVTAHLLGAMIEAGVPGIGWDVTISDAFSIADPVCNVYDILFQADLNGYGNVTLEQCAVFATGMKDMATGEEQIHDDWMSLTAADNSFAKRHARRMLYVYNHVSDKPVVAPGTNTPYGSPGENIIACVAEKMTTTLYEDLVAKYLYAPLGMKESGFGRLCSEGVLDGPWQHSFDGQKLVADKTTMLPGYDLSYGTCSGEACMSAGDMARFLTEEITAAPVIFKNQRTRMQTLTSIPNDPAAPGGWLSGDSDHFNFAGDNGVCLAVANVILSQHLAYAAMSNASDKISGAAVNDAQNALVAIDANFDDIFGPNPWPIDFDIAHSCPAIACADGGSALVFARRHDGTVYVAPVSNPRSAWGALTQLPPTWVFTSGLAAAMTPSTGRAYVCGRGTDNQIYWAHSADGVHWTGGGAVPMGNFETGPGIACNADGTIVHVAAVGLDHKMYLATSHDSGGSWVTRQAPIGAGVFTSQPAIATTDDGQTVYVLGRGSDYRIWWNKSVNAGHDFEPHWAPIGAGLFSGGPAAACSANGANVVVAARGLDSTLWAIASGDAGYTFEQHWQRKDNIGPFMGAPAIATNSTNDLYVSVIGSDMKLYGGYSQLDVTYPSGSQVCDAVYAVGTNYFL